MTVGVAINLGPWVLVALIPLILGVAIVSVGACVFIRSVRDGYVEGERELRIKDFECLQCGYRLKGNVSGTCPECGHPVDPSAYERKPPTSSPS